jgi:hypothetical protein
MRDQHKILVKEEKQAQRCEICHQDDLFDPITGNCMRCREVAITPFAKISQLSDKLNPVNFSSGKRSFQDIKTKIKFSRNFALILLLVNIIMFGGNFLSAGLAGLVGSFIMFWGLVIMTAESFHSWYQLEKHGWDKPNLPLQLTFAGIAIPMAMLTYAIGIYGYIFKGFNFPFMAILLCGMWVSNTLNPLSRTLFEPEISKQADAELRPQAIDQPVSLKDRLGANTKLKKMLNGTSMIFILSSLGAILGGLAWCIYTVAIIIYSFIKY